MALHLLTTSKPTALLFCVGLPAPLLLSPPSNTIAVSHTPIVSSLAVSSRHLNDDIDSSDSSPNNALSPRHGNGNGNGSVGAAVRSPTLPMDWRR
jgi:hypothetical protein